MGNYFNELRWKIIRANSLLQLIHQVTIEIRFQKSLAQERLKSNLEFRNQIIVSKGAKIRNRYNQVPHLTQDTNGKVTNSQKTPQTRAKRSALSQQVTTKHI